LFNVFDTDGYRAQSAKSEYARSRGDDIDMYLKTNADQIHTIEGLVSSALELGGADFGILGQGWDSIEFKDAFKTDLMDVNSPLTVVMDGETGDFKASTKELAHTFIKHFMDSNYDNPFWDNVKKQITAPEKMNVENSGGILDSIYNYVTGNKNDETNKLGGSETTSKQEQKQDQTKEKTQEQVNESVEQDDVPENELNQTNDELSEKTSEHNRMIDSLALGPTKYGGIQGSDALNESRAEINKQNDLWKSFKEIRPGNS